MAVITRIRQYFWLLVVMMALGVVGFIFMDSGNQPTAGPDTVGVVNGKNISWSEFQKAESALYSGTSNYLPQRSSIWNYFLEEAIVTGEAEKLGLGVSNKELTILQFGQNGKFHSDVIKTRNTNQQTRQLNQNELDTIKKILLDPNRYLPEDYRKFWTFQQKEIVKSRLQNKIAALVSKAAFTPTWMAETIGENQNQKADIAFVKIPFGTIPEDQIKLTDADYSNFMQERKSTYMRDEPSRKLGYVIFNIKPTGQDSIELVKNLNKTKADFAKTSEDSLFVIREGGAWNDVYVLEAALPKNITTKLMTLPVGTIVGPYLDGDSYAITKIIDRRAIPDSVRSRHILIKAADQLGYYSAIQKIDSLKTLVEDGKATFASLASVHGEDATKSKAGDLGYVASGAMVKPFNDLIFYRAEKGNLYTVATQFGVHLVEVTGKKFTNNLTGVKMATVKKLIIPSLSTQSAIVGRANMFARNNPSPEAMKAAAEADPTISYVESKLVKENDFFVDNLGANSNSRKFVQWAFNKNTKKGEVNANIYQFASPSGIYNDKAVVGALKAKVKAGMPPVEVMKEELKALVTFQKKGTLIKEKIGDAGDLASLAANFSVKIDTAANVAFSTGFIPGIGNEPKVVSAIFSTAEGSVSQSVIGNGGVFVVKPLRMLKSNTPVNVDIVRTQQDQSFSSQVKSNLINSLKKKAKIKDSRSVFY